MTTRIADVVVPEIFTPYMMRLTEQKSRIIQSGAVARNPLYDAALAGGGIKFNEPAWNDLDASDASGSDDVSSDDPAQNATPGKIDSHKDEQVRLSRNKSWETMDLAAALAGDDPSARIASAVAGYWARRGQAALLATMAGVFADNDAAPSGSDTHTAGDMTNDITGAFQAGVTDFSAESLIDATLTSGDSLEDYALMIVHSVVYAKMRKNNLIDYIRDSDNDTRIRVFGNLEVIVDDGMPVTANNYDTWVFGPGAINLGLGTPLVPTEVDRAPRSGNGGGADTLHSRLEWIIHPPGHRFIAAASGGGPTNAATAGNLANAASWSRQTPERKQVKIARLRTTEA